MVGRNAFRPNEQPKNPQWGEPPGDVMDIGVFSLREMSFRSVSLKSGISGSKRDLNVTESTLCSGRLAPIVTVFTSSLFCQFYPVRRISKLHFPLNCKSATPGSKYLNVWAGCQHPWRLILKLELSFFVFYVLSRVI